MSKSIWEKVIYSDDNDGKRFKDMAIDSTGTLLLYLENNEIMEFDSESLKKTRVFELETHPRLKAYFYSQKNVFVFFDTSGKNLYYHGKETEKTELIYTFDNEVLLNFFGNKFFDFILKLIINLNFKLRSG